MKRPTGKIIDNPSSGRDAKAASRLSPDAFRSSIDRSGWKIVDLAYRWGITENYLSRLIADPNRPAHWDDAVRGIADVSAADLRLFRKYRLANPLQKQPTRRKKTMPEELADEAPLKSGPDYSYVGFLEKGDILAVTEDMTREGIFKGDEGLILAITEDEKGMHYQIDFGGIVLWLRTQEISLYMVETGRFRDLPVKEEGSEQ